MLIIGKTIAKFDVAGVVSVRIPFNQNIRLGNGIGFGLSFIYCIRDNIISPANP